MKLTKEELDRILGWYGFLENEGLARKEDHELGNRIYDAVYPDEE